MLVWAYQYGDQGIFYNSVYRNQTVGVAGRIALIDFFALDGEQAVGITCGVALVYFAIGYGI